MLNPEAVGASLTLLTNKLNVDTGESNKPSLKELLDELKNILIS